MRMEFYMRMERTSYLQTSVMCGASVHGIVDGCGGARLFHLLFHFFLHIFYRWARLLVQIVQECLTLFRQVREPRHSKQNARFSTGHNEDISYVY